MRKINECVSLINELEIGKSLSSLQKNFLLEWVDTNKNITSNKYQEELVQIVESVLSENKINESEKIRFLNVASDQVVSYKYEIAVICDLKQRINEINLRGNTEDLMNLQTWFSDYNSSKKYNELPESIYSMIENVIGKFEASREAGRIKALAEEVDRYLEKLRFYSKVDFLRRKVRKRENIGIYLLDILDKKENISKVHKVAERKLSESLNSYSGMLPRDPEIIFISLVLIALFEYDGNFYERVRNTYKGIYNMYTDQKIEGLIRYVLSKYKWYNKGTNVSRTRVISVALINTIVPQHYLPDFFEFIYDIYKINLDCNIPDDLFDEFEFAYRGISDDMNTENDSYRTNVTKKTYKLIKTTKALLMDDEEALIRLSLIVVKIIDKKIWGLPLELYNPYLKYGFEKWSEKFNSDNKRERKGELIHSIWVPQYQLINGTVYLIPPVHKVKNEYDYNTIIITIINDKNILYEDNSPDIREIIGGYKVISTKILLDNPLGKLEYLVYANNEIIYNSESKLHRKFIVFDEKGNEIKNNTDYEGSAIFCYKGDNDKLQNYSHNHNYNLAENNVGLSDIFVIEDEIFSFSQMIKPGVFGEEIKNCFVINNKNIKIPVYKKIQYLMFDCDNQTELKSIYINEIERPLSDFNVRKQERKGTSNYVVEIQFEKPDIYKIRVPHVDVFTIAYDPNLKFDQQETDENSFAVNIQTGLSKQTIELGFSVDEFDIANCSFINRGEKYYYYVDFKFDFYRISNMKWRSFFENIWIDEIGPNTNIEIYNCEFDEISITSDNNQVLGEITLNGKGIYKKANIGFIASFKNSTKFVILGLRKDGVIKKKIYCYNQCVINEKQTEMSFDPFTKRLTIHADYFGKGDVFLEILNDENELIYKSGFIKRNEPIDIEELKTFEQYKISFYEKEKTIGLKMKKLIIEYNKKFYAYEDLCGCVLKIKEANYNRIILGGKFIEMMKVLRNTHLLIYRRISARTFEGKIFIQTINGAHYLSAINPVRIEIFSNIIDGTIDAYMSNDGDGLLLDIQNKSIMNNMIDKKASDIFTYTLQVEKRNK